MDSASKAAWIAIAFLFSFLSFDEIGSIHERVGNLVIGREAYLATALLAGMILTFATFVLWKNNTNRRTLVLLLVGIALLASAAPNEYLEHHIHWPEYLIGPRIAFEEGLELSGVLLCLIGITSYQPAYPAQEVDRARIWKRGRSTGLQKVLLVGLVFHIGMAWMAVHAIEIGFRGNPAVWYFMAVFYFLAWFFLLQARTERYYLLISGYFTVLSTSSMYFILPVPASFLLRLGIFGNPSILLMCHLLIAFLLYFLIVRNLTWRVFLQFAGMSAMLVGSWYANNQFITYVVAGLFSLSTARLFLPKEVSAMQKDNVQAAKDPI